VSERVCWYQIRLLEGGSCLRRLRYKAHLRRIAGFQGTKDIGQLVDLASRNYTGQPSAGVECQLSFRETENHTFSLSPSPVELSS
jgi:hypothetical protein